MDLSELVGGEHHPVYQAMATSNQERQYDFLHSVIGSALSLGRPLISESLIKALNFHVIVGLHHAAGQYRSHKVHVGQRDRVVYSPPAHHRVEPLMDDLVNELNWQWKAAKPFDLAAHALWRINNIHPFVNGNGRTARAVCYFVLCVKLGGILPQGTRFLEVLKQEPIRGNDYVPALQEADKGNLGRLTALIVNLVQKQVATPS